MESVRILKSRRNRFRRGAPAPAPVRHSSYVPTCLINNRDAATAEAYRGKQNRPGVTPNNRLLNPLKPGGGTVPLPPTLQNRPFVARPFIISNARLTGPGYGRARDGLSLPKGNPTGNCKLDWAGRSNSRAPDKMKGSAIVLFSQVLSKPFG